MTRYGQIITVALLSVVCLPCLIASQSAHAEDAKELIDSLFGDRIKTVRRSAGKADDIMLAVDMLAAAKLSADHPKLVSRLCTLAYDLTWMTPKGRAAAIEAMNLLAMAVPSEARDALSKGLSVHRRVFATAKRGEAKTTAGDQLIAAYLKHAALELGAKDRGGALRDYQAALVVAKQIKSPVLAQIEAARRKLQTSKHLDEQIAQLETKLNANSKDEAAATQLVMLYIEKNDDPIRAQNYVFLQSDTKLQMQVSFASLPDISRLSATEAMDMARWYYKLAQKKTNDPVPLYRRAYRFYGQVMTAADARNLQQTGAKLIMARIEQAMGKLGAKLGQPAPAVATTAPAKAAGGKAVSDQVTTASAPARPTIKVVPSQLGTDPTITGTPAPARSNGKSIDLLSKIDTTKDVLSGKWILAEGKLISNDAKFAVLALPVPPATEYDLEIQGQWLDGSGEMFVLLRRDGHPVRFKLNAFADQGTVQGLSVVGGKHLKHKDNQTRVVGQLIKQNIPYTLKCSIRKQGIKITLNGKTIVLFKGEAKECKLCSDDGPAPKGDALSITSRSSKIAFTKIEFRPISGHKK